MLPDAATQHSVKAVDLAVEKNLKPEQTAASKLALFDWKRSLLESFAFNERANQILLEGLSD